MASEKSEMQRHYIMVSKSVRRFIFKIFDLIRLELKFSFRHRGLCMCFYLANVSIYDICPYMTLLPVILVTNMEFNMEARDFWLVFTEISHKTLTKEVKMQLHMKGRVGLELRYINLQRLTSDY